MKILVTGCAGFIGSHLGERLIKEGYEVVGIDCFTDYYSREIKESNIEWLKKQPNFRFIEKDLLELDLVNLLKDIDYVFHEAAQPGVRASWGKDFEIYVKDNILTTQYLLEAAKEVNIKKFIYASSSSIYGDAETYPTPEDTRPAPVSPYGVTKLAGEHLCQLYFKNYKVPVIILRYFTVYGPRQRPDMAFHKFMKAILEGKKIIVYGDGTQTRDFTYVDDVIEANILAMKSDAVGEVFNIGGGSRISINDTLEILRHITNRKVRVKYIEKQKGDVRHTSADISKADKVIGYTPRWDVRSGLKVEWEWVKNYHESFSL